jgi:hypothetical protein
LKIKKKEREKMKKTKLEQRIEDLQYAEFSSNGDTAKWRNLNFLLMLLQMSKSKDYPSIKKQGKGINIDYIPSALEYGCDCDREGMRRRLRGLAARHEADGVHVLLTHDLNSARIDDIGALVDAIEADYRQF